MASEWTDLKVKDFLRKNNIPLDTQKEFKTFSFDVLQNTSKKDLQEIAGKGAGYNIYALLHGEGGSTPMAGGTMKKYADWVRYVFSTIITLTSIGIIFYSIGKNYAALPGHPVMHYILLIFVIILLAYLEGLQIAILALERTSPSTFRHKNRAFVSHTLAMDNNGHNVQRFLVGRQFFVVFVVFLCAQLTTYKDLADDFTWMPEWLFVALIQTGLPGALIVLAFGQLMPQLIATTNPITFMNLPGTWSVIQLCLVFETFGVTHFSWVLSAFVRFVFTMGQRENIKAPEMDDNELEMSVRNQRAQKSKNFRASIRVVDVEKLYADAESNAANDYQNDEKTQGWLEKNDLDNLVKRGGVPAPSTIIDHLVSKKLPVPRYLLPAKHKMFIPPWLVACELLRRDRQRCSPENGNVETKKTFCA